VFGVEVGVEGGVGFGRAISRGKVKKEEKNEGSEK